MRYKLKEGFSRQLIYIYTFFALFVKQKHVSPWYNVTDRTKREFSEGVREDVSCRGAPQRRKPTIFSTPPPPPLYVLRSIFLFLWRNKSALSNLTNILSALNWENKYSFRRKTREMRRKISNICSQIIVNKQIFPNFICKCSPQRNGSKFIMVMATYEF